MSLPAMIDYRYVSQAVSRVLATAMGAILAATVAAPASAQNQSGRDPYGHPQSDQGAGRAFWGVPDSLPQRPLAPPTHLSQASYRDRGPHGDWTHGDWTHGDWTHGDGNLPAPFIANRSIAAEADGRRLYPYGYFGAHGTPHWQRHFGFRQSYTQWTLK